MTESIYDRLSEVEERYNELERLLAHPEVSADYDRVRTLAKERADLQELVDTYRQYTATQKELADTRELLNEESTEEMAALIRQEISQLEERERDLEQHLRVLLLPKDPNDQRNVILEVRAGTGGDEAALFAAELFRMYSRYAEQHGWRVEILSGSDTGIGGFKEIVAQISGEGAYSRLKYESGVHRVQRVPETEASGRIHTSTVTVAVLPEVDEVEVDIRPEDVRTDLFRARGHGGQGVNTTPSAVRLTHLPTGIVVSCQDERSQLQNKMRAWSILRARLYSMMQEAQDEQVVEARRSQVGSAERSEKVRTYNFPQNRVTDHRINYSSHRLEQVLEGELDEFIDQLAAQEQTEKLRAASLA